MTALVATDAWTDARGVVIGGTINEDVMQKIWDLSPAETPLLSRIGRGRTSAVAVDWVRDRLDTPAANAWVENAIYAQSASGATDFANAAGAPKNRFRNYVQSSLKAIALSDISQLVDSVGGAGGFSKNIMDAQKEIMRDIEYQVAGTNTATVIGVAASTAAKAGSIAAFLDTTNTVVANQTGRDAGSGITFNGWNSSTYLFDAMTGTSTVGAISEADVRYVVKNLYKNGATDSTKSLLGYTSPDLKEVISQYMYTSTARIGSIVKESGDSDSRAVSNVEYWQGDFGLLELTSCSYVTTVTPETNAGSFLWILDPAMMELVWLRGPTVSNGPKDGLVDVKWVTAHWTLRFQPEAVGGVVGVDATAAMTAT